jgi:hypothetical protein
LFSVSARNRAVSAASPPLRTLMRYLSMIGVTALGAPFHVVTLTQAEVRQPGPL